MLVSKTDVIDEQFSRKAQALRRRSILALLAALLLALISMLTLEYVIWHHSAINAQLIHVAGRQRMLSQRLCKAGMAMVSADNREKKQRYRSEIETALHDWQEAHSYVMGVESVQTARKQSPFREKVEDLEHRYLSMVEAAQKLSLFDPALVSIERLWMEVDRLLVNEGAYLNNMEALVHHFVEESQRQDHTARDIGLWVGLLLLLTLVVDARLVIQPTFRQLRQVMTNLEDALRRSSKQEREFRTLLHALPDLLIRCSAQGQCLDSYSSGSEVNERRSKEMQGRSLPELMAPAQATALGESFDRLRQHGGLAWIESVLSLGGQWCYAELRLFSIEPGEVMVLLRDVTAERQLDRRVLEAIEQEQQRIGRDLHDGVCQTLSGLNLLLRGISERKRQGEEVSGEQLTLLAEFTNQAVTDTRLIVRGLVPPDLDAHGLELGLRRMLDNLAALHRMEHHCEISLNGTTLSADLSLQLYRITQEAVSNALRHSSGSQLFVRLHVEPSDVGTGRPRELVLTVKDDGVGIPAVQTSSIGSGMGLRTMAYRAQRIGAWLKIERGSDRGTTVCCRLPLRIDGDSPSKGSTGDASFTSNQA